MKPLLVIIFSSLGFSLLAQNEFSNDGNYIMHIKKATGKIIIDGKLDEADWQTATPLTNFKQNYPSDTSQAEMQTIARVTFDDQFIYVSGVCYQPNKYTVQSLRRDYPNSSSDNFFVTLDPFRDKLNGFYFAVTPYGIQKEALIFTGPGGVDNNIDWDNKWYCNATREKDKFIIEMAIPFKTLRYKLNTNRANEWNINFGRTNYNYNEKSSWGPIPKNFRLIDLNFSGKLIWDDAPPSPGKNFSIIPFVLVGRSKDFEAATPANNMIFLPQILLPRPCNEELVCEIVLVSCL